MSAVYGIVLPSDPLNDRVVDPEFSVDATSARYANIPVTLVNSYTLSGDTNVDFRRLPESGSTVFYRGWMLTESEYTVLFDAIKERGVRLLSTPEQYVSAHHLPGWYDIFVDFTPKTVVLPVNPTHDAILGAGASLGVDAFVVKDFVKSRKHEWDTACYAPDVTVLPAVVDEFIRLQENYLVGSAVVREFVELNKNAPEIRVWWANFVPVVSIVHPDFSGSTNVELDVVLIDALRSKVQELGNPFVTTDLAQDVNGEWVVIEVGDGQVSGFPADVNSDDVELIFSSVLGAAK